MNGIIGKYNQILLTLSTHVVMSEEKIKYEENVVENERQETKEPSLYRVILLSDNYTPMDFVVYVLEIIFHKSPAEETRIMLDVHKAGPDNESYDLEKYRHYSRRKLQSKSWIVRNDFMIILRPREGNLL